MRVLIAVAPSGGEIRFIKYSESDKELSWFNGVLSQAEDMTFWKAMLAARKPGVENWAKARALLESCGWTVTDEQ